MNFQDLPSKIIVIGREGKNGCFNLNLGQIDQGIRIMGVWTSMRAARACIDCMGEDHPLIRIDRFTILKVVVDKKLCKYLYVDPIPDDPTIIADACSFDDLDTAKLLDTEDLEAVWDAMVQDGMRMGGNDSAWAYVKKTALRNREMPIDQAIELANKELRRGIWLGDMSCTS
jgi:hypothetical protein